MDGQRLEPEDRLPASSGLKAQDPPAMKHCNLQASGTACLGFHHTKADLRDAPDRQPVVLVVS